MDDSHMDDLPKGQSTEGADCLPSCSGAHGGSPAVRMGGHQQCAWGVTSSCADPSLSMSPGVPIWPAPRSVLPPHQRMVVSQKRSRCSSSRGDQCGCTPSVLRCTKAKGKRKNPHCEGGTQELKVHAQQYSQVSRRDAPVDGQRAGHVAVVSAVVHSQSAGDLASRCCGGLSRLGIWLAKGRGARSKADWPRQT